MTYLYLTAEQIAERADKYEGPANRAEINRLFRRQDDSHLAPIFGRFNVTERAIRRIRRAEAHGTCLSDGLEYAYALEAEMSNIVNGDF